MENKLQKTETKYYIPAISEFHVGFEYEEKNNDGTWFKSEIYGKSDFENLCETPIEHFRVKCLDRADLEELGWEESPDEPEEWFWAYKGNSELQLYIDTIPEIGGIQGVEIFNKFGLCFRGYIKNKSELKCLMAQLDIN